MRPSYSESHNTTRRHTDSLTYAKEWWILSTSMKPDDEELDNWRTTLPKHYDHVSEIGQPAKFAQALAHMVAEQIGPRGEEGSFNSTTGGTETEKTKHKTQWVMHGPVVYTDSPYDTLDGITDRSYRTAALMFTKGKDHAAQKEYRFVVLNEGADEETVLLQISGMMRDALKQTEHGLVRHARVTLKSGAREETEPPQGQNEAAKPTVKQISMRERSAEREEWKCETRGLDGQVLSSDGGLRESVRERTLTQRQEPERDELQKPTDNGQDRYETGEAFSSPDPLNDTEDMNGEQHDEDVVKELALEEIEWDDRNVEDDELAIPIRTVTGRVYKSIEEMMSDPTYPMSPMGKVWQEDANTPDEITKTYRAIDVLDMKMKDVEEQFRQDIASAVWYAMLCIRNIYGRLGDIEDTVSIEKKRFVVIRLKDNEALNAVGRIVIAPSGAYAYSLHLPNEEQLGHGGLEWGTKFFPIGGQFLAQLVEHGVVGAPLGEPSRVLLRVHRGQHHQLLVGRQPGGHVREAQEDAVADDVEEGRWDEARPLPGHLAVLAPPAVAPVFHRFVVGLSDGVLLEAVPGDPAVLLGASELRPDLRREPVEQVEQSARIPAHQGPGQAQGLAAGVCEDPRGDALGRPSPLVLMDLVTDQQVEEALHPLLHVVR